MWIASYFQLRRHKALLEHQQFGYAVLDEAQFIKNTLSLSARAAKRLQAEARLALSGTPMENNVAELWSLFDFVLPGYLPPLREFLRRHDQGRRPDASPHRRIAGQDRGLGRDLLQILTDGQRLGQHLPVVGDQGRHQPLRVQRQIVGRALAAVAQVVGDLIRRQPLQRQDDAHPPSRRCATQPWGDGSPRRKISWPP